LDNITQGNTDAARELIAFDLQAMISDEECLKKRQVLILEYNVALDMLSEETACSSITTFDNVIEALELEINIIQELKDEIGHSEEQTEELQNAISFLKSVPYMSYMIDGEIIS
jgi:hypothetical protein